MAMDLETNGIHNLSNGSATDAFAQPQPAVNGTGKPADTSAPVDPITNVSSGIEGVGELLGHQPDNALLFGGSEDAALPSALDSVEAPTSDVRDEPAPEPASTAQASMDSTQKVPETQLEPSEASVDKMDTTQDAPEASAPSPVDPSPAPTKPMTNLSLETQQSQAAAASADQDMEDAPPSGKVRPREDDDVDMQEAEREAKRAKTQEEPDALAEFTPVKTEQPNGDTTPATAPSTAPASAAAPAQGTSSVQTAVGYKKWPSAPMTEAQRKFLLERIRNTKKIKVSLAFKDPVDPVALGIPTYHDFVKTPMDLSTIESKLKEGKYPYIVDFMADLDQIIANSELFNSSSHPITQNGYNMRAYFLKGTDRLPKEGDEPAKVAKPVKKPSATVPKQRRESRGAQGNVKSPVVPTPTPTAAAAAAAASSATADTFPVGPDGMPLIRRESTTERPKREIHRPAKDLPYNTAKPKKKKYQHELKFCESVLAELMKPKYAAFSFPFLSPVDPVALNIPSYLKIIKKPMDFGTIEKNLQAGQYQSAKEFHADAQLVFANCYKFNPEGDAVHEMGKKTNALFDSLWREKADWLAQHAPEAAPPSPGSSEDEEEDEDEEDSGPAQAQILAIQQQIAQLNEAANQLLQQQKRKGASPKALNKKKSASKPAVPHKRKNTQLSVPPPPKAAKQKARARPMAPLSYAQKQEISDGISTLGDADMRRAVQIIRNGCPNLADTNDDEMELDMDEINDDTLRDLLKFIKSVRGPKATAAADDDYDPPRPSYPKPTATRPKKNKPMGKTEQEDSLRRIQEKMQSFNGPASGSSQSPAANQGESSEDESSGSESEEE